MLQQENEQHSQIDPAVEKANHQVFHSLMTVQQSVEGKFATIQVENQFNLFLLKHLELNSFFQRVVSEIDSMQREQYNESLNNDVLLTRIENLERKLQVKSYLKIFIKN